MWTEAVRRTVLPNGLTLLIQRDASAPVVAVVTHVRAGYFDEPDEWVGIAHVLEHMFFKGTARRGPGDLARETQMLGGYLNASTIYDKTVYYTVLPSADGALARAVDIQCDALINAALDQGELSRELEVVIQEANRKLDNPPAVATETLYKLLFSVHRMRRWRIGTEEGLRRIDATALREYYRTRYAPARTIVSMVGDLDPHDALELGTRAYAGWTVDAGPIEGSPAEPAGARPALELLSGDIQRPLMVCGWRTVPELHADSPALDIAAAILGSGRGSWLSRFVRTPGLAASTSASHYTPTEVGVFDLAIQGDMDRMDEAVGRAMDLVAKVARDGPDDAELARVRALMAVRWSRHFETMDGRAGALCEFEALGGYALADQLFEQALAVTGDDVRRVASQYLDPSQASAVLYLPRSATTRPRLAGGWPLQPRTATGLAVASPALPKLPGGRAGRRARERETVGGVVHVPHQGIDLLVQSKKGAGLVSLCLFVPGMHDEEDETTAGISWLLARASLRGAGGMDAEELSLAAESLGGAIGAAAGLDGIGWSITVPVAELPKAARLLRAVALEPALNPKHVEIERELQAADAIRVRDDMFRYPLQRVLSLAFPDDPYGLPPLGEPDGVRSLTPARVRSWSDALRSRRAVAVAVGDLTPAKLASGLAHLGDWPGDATAKRVDLSRLRTGRGVEERDKAQSALAMAFPGAASDTPRRFALEVLGGFLSGLAGRLFQLLREEKALAYTVTAYPWLQRRTGTFLSYIATSPDRENEARDAMLAALEDVARGEVSEPEIERARNYVAGLVQIGRQTAAAITGQILGAWAHDVMQDLPELPARLQAVTAEEMVREAREVFRIDTRAEFVVRGTKR